MYENTGEERNASLPGPPMQIAAPSGLGGEGGSSVCLGNFFFCRIYHNSRGPKSQGAAGAEHGASGRSASPRAALLRLRDGSGGVRLDYKRRFAGELQGNRGFGVHEGVCHLR